MFFRRGLDFVNVGRRREFLILSALFLLALLPRILGLSVAPPGLNGDEVYNLIDARSIHPGNLPLFMPGNLGREAFYFYLLALSLRLFGTTIFALRLPSVLLGSGSVLFCYLLGREAFDRRVGTVSGALVAASFWPVMLSRIGLRAISLTFLTTFTIYWFYLALREGRLRHWLLAGTAFGLTLYTYIPARIFPLVIAGWLGCVWWRRREELKANTRHLALSLLLAALLMAPFTVYMIRYPDLVNQRLASMSNALDRVRAGEPQALLGSVGGVLKMFSVEGDQEWRYHLSRRPVFDPLTSIFFYVGLGLTLHRALRPQAEPDRQPEHALLLLWTGAMLAPNAVLNDNPSFIRAAGAIVPIYLMTGIGVTALFSWVQSRIKAPRWIGPALFGVGLAATLAYTSHSYLSVWANNAEVREIYHADQALMARYLEENPPPTEARVFAAYDYVYDRPTALSFALFTDQDVAWFARENTFPWPRTDTRPKQEAWYLIPVQQRLPTDVLDELQAFAEQETVRFASGEEAFTIYRLTERAYSRAPAHQASLSFAPGLRLDGYDLPESVTSGQEISIRLYWEIAAGELPGTNRLTYAQVHLADATGVVRTRAESLIGYPQAGWKDGDHFIQDMLLKIPSGMLPGPASLSFGLRDDSGQALDVMKSPEQGTSLVVRSQPLADFAVTPGMTVFDGELVLAGANYRPLLTPGTALNIELNWVALQQPEEDFRLQIQLIGQEASEPLLQQTYELWPELYPPTRWQPLEPVTTLHGLHIPLDLEAESPVHLQLQLLPAGVNGNRPLTVSSGSAVLGVLDWDLRTHVFDVPQLANQTHAQFGEDIRLLGYEVDSTMAYPGGVVRLVLAWQAIATPATNYTVFNHLVARDGELEGQLDGPPVGDAWLTGTWLPGEVVVEAREIPIKAEATPGPANLIVGLYTADDMQRLPVILEGQVQPADQLQLQQIEISAVPEANR